MEQEFQPEQVFRCACGAACYEGDDLIYPMWIGGDPWCDEHKICNPLEEAEDAARLSLIIEKIKNDL